MQKTIQYNTSYYVLLLKLAWPALEHMDVVHTKACRVSSHAN